VKLVAENLVPVALNTDRLPDTAAGKFFRALMQQWPQGLWVVSPDGKVLGFHYHKPKPPETYAQGQTRWIRETAAMIADAIRAAGPLPKRDGKNAINPFANRGKGPNPEGGIRLAVSVIALRGGRQEGPPVVDSIFLPGDDWVEFRPKGTVKVGQEWTISADAASRFAPALSPLTDSIFSPKPEDVTVGKITARVERVTESVAVIRFAGTWASAHDRDRNPKFPIRCTAVGDGVGVLDVRTGKLTNMIWLLSGTFQNVTAKPQQTASVIEWNE
jgi:hypothetical protein